MEGVEKTITAEAAEGLVALLADEGVSHLFMNPGTDTAPIQEALAAARANHRPLPRVILCTHELVALMAACGHHSVSGQPQAVMVHVDAGTLNLGAGINQAQRNNTPVVLFAGRAPYTSDPSVPGHRDTHIHWTQEQLDQPSIVRNYVKWHMEVPRGRELAPITRRAFQVARTAPSGPVYVMLPREALMEPGASELPRQMPPPAPPGPDPGALRQLAAILAAARRPVIVTARTGRAPETVPVLAGIAELIGAPVIDQRDFVNMPSEHHLNARSSGYGLLRSADVVLVLDSEVPWIPAHTSPPPEARVLQIDVDCLKPTMPLWTYPVELGVTADTAIALPLLSEELCRLATPERQSAWAERRREAEAEVAGLRATWARWAASPEPAHAPEALLAALNRALPEDAIVLEEAVTNREALNRQISRPPGHYIGGASPALGWPLGAAVGAKLARPEAPVVAVCGDGSFNFGVPTTALWVARRHGTPFVTVILDNGAYLASKRPVQGLYPRGVAVENDDFPETDLGPANDYTLLAEACGGAGRVVTAPTEIGEAMQWALAQTSEGRCAILDCRLPHA